MISTSSVFAQTGKIAGVVSDKSNNETLIGCSVGISGSTVGASTDIDGKYVISNLKPGSYKVIFRYIGYQTKEIVDIVVAAGKVTNLNVLLEPSKTQQLAEVTVTSTYRQANTSALYAQQKNSAVISDGISSEVIAKSPDKNTGEVLKRVSGTTIQDNKFVIVRGLSDRYNSALIDGSPLPSTEPNRKAFSFDIVPSNLIDNVVISKTATPDLPADFAGGTVQVSTKDVPDQDFLSFGLGFGYNSFSTFKDFYSGDREFADYLTFGSSSRKLPVNFPSTESIFGRLSSSQNIAAINSLNNSYTVLNKSAMPTQNYQITLGRVREIGKQKNRFGTTLSVSYRTSENIIPDIQRQFFAYNYLDQQYLFNSNLGVLANFAYTYKRSKITFKNLYNRILDDRYSFRTGSNSQSSSSDNRFYAFDLLQKSILKSTIEGDHNVGEKKARIKWNLSFSNILNDQPDQRKVNYKQNNPGDLYIASNTNTGLDNSRLFSSLNENIVWAGINYERPIKFLDSKMKFGLSSNYRTRDFNVRFIGLNLDNNYPNSNDIRTRPLQSLFGKDLINDGAYILDELPNGNDRYNANSSTNSVFGMLDSKFTEKFRAVYGVRVEQFNLGLTTAVSTGKVASLNNLDILPSANLSYALTPKANLRLSYYRTLARPEFRELAPFSYYDYEEVLNVQGYAGLVRSFINNADLRFEIYPSAGQIFSISAFYKNFTNAIESSVYDANSTPVKTFFNSDKANVYGLELEARKTLEFLGDNDFLKNTTVYANVSYSKSEVKEKNLAGNFTRSRPLTGQSPYIINAGLQESLFNNKISLNILYNKIATRLYSVGGGKIGDIYENSRGSLDAQFGIKAFKSKGEFKFNAGNILNEYNNFYVVPISSSEHNLSNSTGTFKKYRTGANYSLSFSYNFK
ncbi:TonB-dependent receptor [Pelobium sp.]|nr:TonB-dependent receptor [Pelobium sp.]MDA9555177.1 TonB-dependent receptor [Pelobium sp.]